MRKNIDTIVDFLKFKKAQKIYRVFIYIFFVLIFCYLFLCITAKYLETVFSFPGVTVNTKEYTAPDMIIPELEFEEINITSKTGKNINGLFINNNAEKTIYYFHGNGGELKYFYSEIQYLSDLGYNVMSYDYPGYGKSTGTPYFENVTGASEEFFNYMSNTKDILEENIIVWGFSIGSGVSIEWAKDKNFDRLILVATFASRYHIGKENFGFIPQKLFFLQNSFVSTENISLVDEPILMIHGNKDDIISIEQGKEVFDNISSEEKYFIELDDWGHNGIIGEYGDVIESQIRDFLDEEKFEDTNIIIDENQKNTLRDFILKNRQIKKSDMNTDASITKFVNNTVPFTEISYIPENLENVSSEFVYDAKGGASQLRQEANLALQDMSKAYYETFSKKITVVSAYRSYAYQAGIKSRGCPDNLCAKAGYSEHQSGLGVDFWSASSESVWKNNQVLWKNYQWLMENAHLYGFHNTYQKGLEVDGYEIEPWHWRYLGEPLATYLKDNDMTFAEFYNKYKKTSSD